MCACPPPTPSSHTHTLYYTYRNQIAQKGLGLFVHAQRVKEHSEKDTRIESQIDRFRDEGGRESDD